MERRINKKIESYITEFKENIKQKTDELRLKNEELNDEDKDKEQNYESILSQLVQYVYDYERLTLVKEDFTKRKRVKNSVHLADRCCAKRANGEQCTRRRKDDATEYCGTHLKGRPHGVCDTNEDNKPHGKKVEVWAQDIQGIMYYIDNMHNVYQVEDILQNKINPKVIAKYLKIGETFTIPDFNI
jgi:hypothetical protein